MSKILLSLFTYQQIVNLPVYLLFALFNEKLNVLLNKSSVYSLLYCFYTLNIDILDRFSLARHLLHDNVQLEERLL